MNIPVEDNERDEIFARLKSSPENNKCFDCDKKHPKWASVNIGLYLCLDCAGKHREYGPQITFVRSLNLDTWNKRYITFMELGGNAKALEYFTKHGLKAPFDYKNATIQKYKAELTKKVDIATSTAKPEETSKPVFAAKVEEDKPRSDKTESLGSSLVSKSHSDKPKHGEKAEDDPFADIILNKNQTQTKGFAVEFKNKSNFAPSKGRIAAKKIDNIDINQLSLNEDGTNQTKSKFDMNESPFGLTTNSTNSATGVKEVHSKGNSPYIANETTDDKLKKFSSAKAISSDAFRNDSSKFEPANMREFRSAKGISSAQYFGEKEDNPDEEDYYQTAENVRDFISTFGGKLKEKADVFVNKLKDEWSQ